ncbi:hypothetical protein HYX70_03840 [Candidatus Saccharibacteria bacterium]|nr:hypothetical protein [Candidatus Saccharibacteria bacterium]
MTMTADRPTTATPIPASVRSEKDRFLKLPELPDSIRSLLENNHQAGLTAAREWLKSKEDARKLDAIKIICWLLKIGADLNDDEVDEAAELADLMLHEPVPRDLENVIRRGKIVLADVFIRTELD